MPDEGAVGNGGLPLGQRAVEPWRDEGGESTCRSINSRGGIISGVRWPRPARCDPVMFFTVFVAGLYVYRLIPLPTRIGCFTPKTNAELSELSHYCISLSYDSHVKTPLPLQPFKI